MRVVITILVSFLLYSTIQGQSFTYFNKQILLDSSNQLSIATIPHTDGYYTVGMFGFTHTIIYFTNIDIEGNIVEYYVLDDSPDITAIVSGKQFIETKDGYFTLIYQKQFEPLGENTDIVLIKFTKEGEIVWSKQFGREGIDGARKLIQTKDGGFLIVGFLRVGENNEMYAVKTDSRGALEWDNHYCLHLDCWAFSVDETIDGGYILGGRVRTVDNASDMYVVKIDSLGNQEWEKTYGEGGSDPAGQVYVLEDGNFLLQGGIRQGSNRRHYFAKLDQSGEIMWEKIYDIPNSFTMQTHLVFREDRGFIGVAAMRAENDRLYPLIMNFDAEADTLWTKPIIIDPDADTYIKDIDKIDGGYVLTGYKYFPTPQYGWLVTIDEEGNFCEELGCVETVVDIENTEAQRHRGFLQISPNPVRGQATVQYQIPKEGVLKVYDYQGRLIENEKLTMNNSSLTLEVEDWSIFI